MSEPRDTTVVTRVGLVGAGALGGAIARRLLHSGVALVVCEPDAARAQACRNLGAQIASTASAVGALCDIVLLSLPTPDTILAVVSGADGLLAARRVGLLIVDLSTNAPACAKTVGAASRAAGCAYLDAPLTGGAVGARDGTFTAIVGGDADDLARARPVLERFTRRIVHVGPQGHGAFAKLVHNMVGEIQVHAFAEALCLGARFGLDLDRLYDVLANGMATSRVLTELLAPNALQGRLAPSVTLDLAAKDQTLLSEATAEKGLGLSFTPLVRERQRLLQERGCGGLDVSATLSFYEELFGVTVRVSAAAVEASGRSQRTRVEEPGGVARTDATAHGVAGS